MATEQTATQRTWPVAAALLLVTTVAVAGFVHSVLNRASSDLLRRHAADISATWSDYFNSSIPDIAEAYASRNVTDDQIEIIRGTELFGSVFRFKMFAPDGALFFVSDEGRYLDENGEAGPEPLSVLASGDALVFLKDGQGNPNRPATYSEAYVPAYDNQGRVIGVMEIYADLSTMAETLQASFRTLKITLPLLAALIYLLPAVGVLVTTHQKKKHAAHLAQARLDPLTGALTRGALLEEAEQLFANANRQDGEVAVLFIDADHFKSVNDTLGHAAGDAFLRTLVQRLREEFRHNDLIGRIGGDEFVIVIPETNRETLRHRASEVCKAARAPMTLAGKSFHGSVSVGAALAFGAQGGFSETLALADKALYAAKRHGRGCAVVGGGAEPGSDGELIPPNAA